jgi:DNA repair ATPase RecN
VSREANIGCSFKTDLDFGRCVVIITAAILIALTRFIFSFAGLSVDGGQPNALKTSLSVLKHLSHTIDESCSEITAAHLDAFAEDSASHSSCTQLFERARLVEDDFERYDELTGKLCTDIADLRSLVTQLPEMVKLQRDEFERLSAWEDKLDRMTKLEEEHFVEVGRLCSFVASQRAYIVQLRDDVKKEALGLELAKQRLADEQTRRAKEEQVKLHLGFVHG